MVHIYIDLIQQIIYINIS